MIVRLKRNWDVTTIPVNEIYRRVKMGGWKILRTRLEGDKVLMDLCRPC